MNFETSNFSNPIVCLASLDRSKALKVTVTDSKTLDLLATDAATDPKRETIVLKALPLIQMFSNKYIPAKNLPQFNNGDTLLVKIPLQGFADWLNLGVQGNLHNNLELCRSTIDTIRQTDIPLFRHLKTLTKPGYP